MSKARIIEMFTSIQGEGLYVGERQLFIRFHGCNISCRFCDEKKRKKDEFSEYEASELIKEVVISGKRNISLTGGEPLLQADFLREVLPDLKKEGRRIYLETNGILTAGLLKILEYVDIISMDLKLPSSTGLKPYWDEHSIFLKEAAKKEVFVKSVVTPQTILSDISTAASIVKKVDENITFILQPASRNGGLERIDLLPTFFESAREKLPNVRIIPQIHKFLGVK